MLPLYSLSSDDDVFTIAFNVLEQVARENGFAIHIVPYVTGFGKTLRMGFFQKFEFDAWLISSSIELTRVQVLGRLRASLWRYSALFVIAPHPQ